MTFDEYWQRLCDKNPSLKEESAVMKITVAKFKEAIHRAFDVDSATKATNRLNETLRRMFEP